MQAKTAISKLAAEVKNDPSLRESYKKKIVEAFYKQCVKKQVDEDLPLPLLWRCAEAAADNLLDELCGLA